MTHRFSPRRGALNGIFTYVNQVSKLSNEGDLIYLSSNKNIKYRNGTTLSDFFNPDSSIQEKTYIYVEGQNSSFTFTFSTISVNITGYNVLTDKSIYRAMKNWIFEGKNNESNKWKLIHNEKDYQDFLIYSPKYFTRVRRFWTNMQSSKLR